MWPFFHYLKVLIKQLSDGWNLRKEKGKYIVPLTASRFCLRLQRHHGCRCRCIPFGLKRGQGLLLTEAVSISSLALSCKQTHLSSGLLLFYGRLDRSRIVTKVHDLLRVFRQILFPNWLLSSPIPSLSAGQCLCLWPWRKEACSWARMQSWLA